MFQIFKTNKIFPNYFPTFNINENAYAGSFCHQFDISVPSFFFLNIPTLTNFLWYATTKKVKYVEFPQSLKRKDLVEWTNSLLYLER